MRFDPNFNAIQPLLDGDFFPKDFAQLITDTSPKPMIIGCTDEESLAWSAEAAAADFCVLTTTTKLFSLVANAKFDYNKRRRRAARGESQFLGRRRREICA